MTTCLFAQDIVRINMTSEKKEFAKNQVLAAAAEKAKASNGRLHFLGLVSQHGAQLWMLDFRLF